MQSGEIRMQHRPRFLGSSVPLDCSCPKVHELPQFAGSASLVRTSVTPVSGIAGRARGVLDGGTMERLPRSKPVAVKSLP
jgi:hypothetical protein